MSATHAASKDHDEPGLYEIRLKGHLDDRWTNWFEGLSFTHEGDGTTILCGPVVDHAVRALARSGRVAWTAEKSA